MKCLLIDGDIIAYKACASTTKTILWEEQVCTKVCNLPEAEKSFDTRIETIKDAVAFDSEKGDVCYVFTSCPSFKGFRRAIFPDYKSNRKEIDTPPSLKFLRELHIKYIDGHVEMPNIEADDLIGIYATDPWFLKTYDDVIVVSEDKDLKTIPCKLLSFNSDDDEEDSLSASIDVITEQEANYNWMSQTLSGDTADNYGGCPRYGLKTAHKLLDATDGSVEEMWKAVVEAYKKAGLSEDYALTMARLARILRYGEYNFKTHEVNLWQML